MANKKGKKPPQFKVGDLVAAKVKGYSFWPGQIEQIPKPGKYQVRFFYTNDIGSTFVVLKPFDALTESERKCKARGFAEALRECEEERTKKKRNKCKGESSSLSPSPIQEPPDQQHVEIENDKDQPADAAKSKKQADEQPPQPTNVEQEQDQQKDEAPTPPETPPPLEISTVQHVQPKKRQTEPQKPPSTKRESKRAKVKIENKHKHKEEEEEEEQEQEQEEEAQLPSKRISKRECEEQVDTDSLRKRQRMEQNGTPASKSTKEDFTTKISRHDKKSASLPKDTSVNETQITTETESGIHMDCSLNDLTSEQANADRGHVSPKSVTKPSEQMQDFTHETIGRLKKKLEQKMEEKEKLKKACMEKKQFEKAAKFLPMFSKHFGALDKAINSMLKDPKNKQNASQFEASIIRCKKHCKFLRECLFNLYSDYGKEQKELREFNKLLVKVVLDLTKNKELSSQGEARLLKKTLKKDTLRKFINDDSFSDDPKEESVGERKENSSEQRTKAR